MIFPRGAISLAGRPIGRLINLPQSPAAGKSQRDRQKEAPEERHRSRSSSRLCFQIPCPLDKRASGINCARGQSISKGSWGLCVPSFRSPVRADPASSWFVEALLDQLWPTNDLRPRQTPIPTVVGGLHAFFLSFLFGPFFFLLQIITFPLIFFRSFFSLSHRRSCFTSLFFFCVARTSDPPSSCQRLESKRYSIS